MDFFFIWISFITVILVGAASPGPDFIVVVRNAVSHSQRAGILTAVGIGVGICVHVTYSILGVATIIAQSVMLYNIIKYIGAAYLIYIGIKAVRSKGYQNANMLQKNGSNPTRAPQSDLKALLDGFLTNILNPKATLFFLALLPQFIGPDAPLMQQIILAPSAGLSAAIWFSCMSIILNRQIIRQRYMACAHWIDRVSGGLLIALGIKLATDKGLAP